MLIFQVRRALVSEPPNQPFAAIADALSPAIRPLIRPAVDCQANILGVPPDVLKSAIRGRPIPYGLGPPTPIMDAEILTDGASLFVVTMTVEERAGRIIRTRDGRVEMEEDPTPSGKRILSLHYMGPDLTSPQLDRVEKVVNEIFNVTFQPEYYESARFKELKAEGRTSPPPPTKEEISAAHLFRDRAAQMLAVSIKASGGLLVTDLPKQLPAEARDRTDDIQKSLQSHGLIDAEIVVVCTKTQAQTARAPSREVLERLSKERLKCACGRSIGDERIEEALTITDLGRSLLDGNRWLTLLLVEELQQVGVPLDRILTEQQVGGDEVDCLAAISGELAFFELKDKDFNLGNAYSFGAKIGIIRPDYPVIFSTQRVGGDAREHFERARLARRSRPREYYPAEDQPAEIHYIEGLSNLPEGIQALASTIYANDARRVLARVLPLASLDPAALIAALESPRASKPESADLSPAQWSQRAPNNSENSTNYVQPTERQ